jgi:fumarate reductase subunit D
LLKTLRIRIEIIRETSMKKSIKPFWWGLFGAGGAISALAIPVLLFLSGLAIPLGWVDAPRYEVLLVLVKHPFTRLFLFALIALSLFHWAHRFRYTLYDGLQLKHLNELVAVICYGSAMVVTLVAGYTLWSI